MTGIGTKRIGTLHGLGLLLAGTLLSSLAYAATVEIRSWYPGQGADFDRVNANRVTVGEEYRTVPDEDLPDGMLLVSDRVGIGTKVPSSLVRLDVEEGGILVGRSTAAFPTPLPPIQALSPANHLGIETVWDSDYLSLILRDRDGVVGGDDKDALIVWGDDPGGALGPDSLRFIFRDGGTATEREVMRLAPNGNVGIGTTLPAGLFHVQGQDDAVSSVLFMPGADTSASGTPALRVGIGTTAPEAPLHIGDGQDTNRILFEPRDGLDNVGIELMNRAPFFIDPAGKPHGDSSYVDFHVRTGTPTDWDARIWYHSDPSGASGPTGLGFFGGGGVGTIADSHLFIDSGGEVGIGTAVPDTALDVDGAISVRGMAAPPAVSPNDQGRIYYDSTSDDFWVSKSGGAYQRLTGGFPAPDYDSGWVTPRWVAVGDRRHRRATFTHGLGTRNVFVYLTGRRAGSNDVHQTRYGVDDTSGDHKLGAEWRNLTLTTIEVWRGVDDGAWDEVRLQIWKLP